MIPDVPEGGIDSRAVVAGDEGVGGLATPELSGTVAGGLATTGGVGPVAAWLEQAAQSPNKIAVAAFLIGGSFGECLTASSSARCTAQASLRRPSRHAIAFSPASSIRRILAASRKLPWTRCLSGGFNYRLAG
jgi:hypothetical protein